MISREKIYEWLEQVTDPEVPALSILDLGIVRDVQIVSVAGEDPEKADITVMITPTYSGCPAMDVIGMNIRMALSGRGFRKVNIEMQLSPAWTTDWMTEAGRRKLRECGIAPPQRKVAAGEMGLFEEEAVTCPHCSSDHTELVSNFGSTSCKALYKCHSCLEPFEHFKCH